MWIEFLGGVGSGKSSLAAALKEQFRVAEYPVSAPWEALDLHLARSLPAAILSGRTGYAARRAVLAGWQTRFSFRHPRLVWQAWKASQELQHLPDWHRKIILSLFLEVAGWYEGVSHGVPPNHMVLVDEGLAHRSINLFAWQTGDLDTKRIQAYVENLPATPLTILVSAPLQVCLERAHRRGLPIRLRGKDPQTVQRFIESSHAVASLAGEVLISRGRSVISIDNSSGLKQAITVLCRQMNETALFQRYLMRPYRMSFSQTAEEKTR